MMKRGIIIFALILLVLPVLSAEIIIQKQPEKLYGFGDVVDLPIKIVANYNIEDFLTINLLCNGKESQIHKEYISLVLGNEKQINSQLPLIKSFIDGLKGKCKAKVIVGDEYVLTNEFSVSSLIFVKITDSPKILAPRETLIITGDANRESGGLVNGIVELNITNTNSTQTTTIIDTVENGYFNIEYVLPENTESGNYFAKANVYEKDFSGEKTNTGFAGTEFSVSQIPTSLEVLFENSEITPGENLKVKAILHDQTGKKIKSNAIITLKNNDLILEQKEVKTDEFLEFPVAYNEPPSEDWSAVAVSNKLVGEASAIIKEKKAVEAEIINRTLIIKNVGNVFYNQTITIEIGNETINLNLTLKVDEEQKYTLSAPEGEYKVNVFSGGETIKTQSVMLTGKAINVKEMNVFSGSFKNIIVWIFIIALIAFFIFVIVRKLSKKNISFTRKLKIQGIRNKEKKEAVSLKRSDSPLIIKNNSTLSLSIKGDKQNSSLICLAVKNLDKLFENSPRKEDKVSVKETIQKIEDIAEQNKAFVYQSNNYIFIVLAPVKTKTFENEKDAINISNKIKEIIDKHNKLFKDKIEFGISLNIGEIVIKQTGDKTEFMSMGTLMLDSKKLALISQGEVLLSKAINDKITSFAKTEKAEASGVGFYKIKEIREREQHKKFLSSFLKRLEEGKD